MYRIRRCLLSSSDFVYKPFDLSGIRGIESGVIGHKNYRVFLQNVQSNQILSPFQDIPLLIEQEHHSSRTVVLPFVCEIPRLTRAKMEVSLTEQYNPIKQDINKKGELRFLPIDPKSNYGMFPRTYESPDKNCEVSGYPGDADPVDVVDISVKSGELKVGDVVPVKLLGSFCFVDNGEADWKIIVSRKMSEELTNSILDEMFGFFEQYKPNQGNYIYDNRKLFSIGETIDILQILNRNYNEIRVKHSQFR